MIYVTNVTKMRKAELKVFKRKCPHCRGKNLYLKRTSPMDAWGCKDCEKKVKYLGKQGLSKKQIKKVFGM